MSFLLQTMDLGTSVTIRNAEKGNPRRIDTLAITRQTVAGKYLLLIASGWQNKEILGYEFLTLTEDELESVRDFLILTAGLEVKITDHNGVMYVGYIITPVFNIVTKRDECSYDIQFEILKSVDQSAITYNLTTQLPENILLENTEELLVEH